jgi:hypothetical protein
MKNKKQIKTFFYMIMNREEREKEMNDFLKREDVVIDNILQSSTTGSVYKDNPAYLDCGVVITIVYHEI